MSKEHFYLFTWIWIVLGIVMFPFLLKVTAPYGRHSRKGWGPMIPNRMGWIFMELPSLVMFVVFFLLGPNQLNIPLAIFFLAYTIHYGNRSIIFPLRTRTSNKLMPLLIALLAVFFNLVNGFINGYYFGTVSDGYSIEWLYDIRFILGIVLFITGMAVNIRYDNHLLALRISTRNGYSIPRRGLFRLVSCPNFFGEILEWAGFAVMTWSPAALAFALWTLVNLIPRALDHHKWYRENFEDYPAERKAVIPYIL
jgi:protein-S-isoprenylcysteine O-methyltransferase Ste14